MDLDLMVAGGSGPADELRSLRAWLVEEDELRGCVQAIERPPDADSLGPVLEVLKVVADPAAGVLAAALVAWVKSRASGLKLVLRFPRGGSVELEAGKIQSLDANGVGDLIERLTGFVNGDVAVSGSGDRAVSACVVDEDVGGRS